MRLLSRGALHRSNLLRSEGSVCSSVNENASFVIVILVRGEMVSVMYIVV